MSEHLSHDIPHSTRLPRFIGRQVIHLHDLDTSYDTKAETATEWQQRRHETLFTLPSSTETDRYGDSLRDRTTVTDASLKDAAEALQAARSDENIRMILGSGDSLASSETDVASMLRLDQELRVELGSYLLAKLAALPELPERVSRNDPKNTKNPNFPGYTDLSLSSHEYVAVLALSMLDATFKADYSSFDTIDINQAGEVTTGQHRYAAHQLLGTVEHANVNYL
jgi:hypothetical protein